MKKPTIKPILVSILLASMSHSAIAANAISKQMDDAFGSLSNVTSPKAYDTARRGVFSGGQVFIKNPTKRVTPVTVTAPSFSAGCGGIDIYGGSFSFINADQMIETFQAIGSNALGYGIKLAVQAGCPTCEQVMTSLEKTAQMINSMNIDSCQAAQGIVGAGVDFATTSQSDTASKTKLAAGGFADDFSSAWTWANEEPDSPSEALKSKNPSAYAKEITGNITWRSLQETDAKTVFGGDDQFLEMLMTMVGSVIVKNPDPSDKEADPKLITLNGYGISLAEVIKGGNLSIYKCDATGADECLDPPLKPSYNITDDGLKKRISDSLYEVFKAQQLDIEWNQQAKDALSFTTVTSSVCMKKIRNAAMSNAGDHIAQDIADLCAGRMALEAAYAQVKSYVETVKASLENAGSSDTQKAAKAKAIAVLESSLLQYHTEYRVLNSTYPTSTVFTTLSNIDFNVSGNETVIEGN